MKSMHLKLIVWRQKSSEDKGYFEEYDISNIDGDMSFLEMIDILNDQLILDNIHPIAFDHDCREGICGACSMYINGQPHGPQMGTKWHQSGSKEIPRGPRRHHDGNMTPKRLKLNIKFTPE